MSGGDHSSGFPSPSPSETVLLLQRIGQDLGGRYELVGYLGRGAFATVWQARDLVTGEAVALKRFEPQLGVGSSFYRELSTLFRLHHPRIVQIINLRETADGARYLILEFCTGGTLRAAVNRAQRDGAVCPAERTRVLGLQLAEGLAAAHRLGVAHRDLKPENVLFATPDARPFGGDAVVKLADFGLARALQTVAPDEGGVLRSLSGSPAYMAPEQFEGSFGAASDLYALGVILYELLHGRLPFEGAPEHLAFQHLRQVPVINRNLPRPWPTLLTALLDKNSTRRISSAELTDQLQAASTGGSSVGAASRGWSVQGAEIAETFAVFSQTGIAGSEFVAVAPNGLFRFGADDGTPRGDASLPHIHRALQAADGGLWFLRGGEMFHWRDGGRLEMVLTLDGNIDAVAPLVVPDATRIAVVRDDEIGDWQLTPTGNGAAPRAAQLWRTTVRSSGLRPSLFRLGDGRIVCAEGPINPRLIVLGEGGRRLAALPLPGLCWDLGGWASGSILYAKLLIGNQFAAYRSTWTRAGWNGCRSLRISRYSLATRPIRGRSTVYGSAAKWSLGVRRGRAKRCSDSISREPRSAPWLPTAGVSPSSDDATTAPGWKSAFRTCRRGRFSTPAATAWRLPTSLSEIGSLPTRIGPPDARSHFSGV